MKNSHFISTLLSISFLSSCGSPVTDESNIQRGVDTSPPSNLPILGLYVGVDAIGAECKMELRGGSNGMPLAQLKHIRIDEDKDTFFLEQNATSTQYISQEDQNEGKDITIRKLDDTPEPIYKYEGVIRRDILSSISSIFDIEFSCTDLKLAKSK